MNTTNIDIKSLLNTLDTINTKNYAFHVYVPSLQKDIPFLQISTSQQKSLIKSVIDSPVYNTEFIYTIRSIIKDNCLDKEVSIDELTLLDKLVICLALRSKSISSTYEFSYTHEGAELKYNIELDSLIEASKSIDIELERVIETQDYKITTRVPTIGIEYQVEKELRSKNRQNNENIQNSEQLRDIVGEAFMTELIKYIKCVEIPRGDTEVFKIEMSNMSPKDGISILGKFPIKVLESILDFVNDYSRSIGSITKIKVPGGVNAETNEVEFIEQEIPINGNFFIIS